MRLWVDRMVGEGVSMACQRLLFKLCMVSTVSVPIFKVEQFTEKNSVHNFVQMGNIGVCRWTPIDNGTRY